MMRSVNLSAILDAHKTSKEFIANTIFPEMPERGRLRKVERIIRGEQSLNADELLTLAAALLVTPNDLYLPKYIDPLKQIKTLRVVELAKQRADEIRNAKTQNDEN